MPIQHLAFLVVAAGLGALLMLQGMDLLLRDVVPLRRLPLRDVVSSLVAATAILVAIRASGEPRSALLLALWTVLLVVVAAVDYERQRIPNLLILPALAAALLASAADLRLTPLSALLGALVGFGLFYAIARVARGGIGAGDVKLAAFIGAISGLPGALYALAYGMLILGLAAALLLALRRVERDSVIPYGPALCVGGWLGMMGTVWGWW